MTETAAMSEPVPSPPPAAEMGLFARAIGVITSPTATFQDVVRSPKPFVMLLLIALVTGIVTALPQFTERGRQAVLNMQVEQRERMTGQPMSDEQYQQLERFSRFNGPVTVVSTLIFTPIAALFFAALYWGIFNAVLGGTASFRQVLGVVAHSMVIVALGAIAAAPFMLTMDRLQMAGPFNLGALVSFLDPESFGHRVLAAINVFTIWQVVVIAIGLGVLYRRKPTPIAVTLLGLYVVLVAGTISLFSSFMGR